MERNKSVPKKGFMILLGVFISLSIAWAYYESDSSSPLLDKPINKPAANSNQKIDEKAKKLMKEMSDNLIKLKEFKFKSQGYFEVIDGEDKKEKLDNSGELFVKRPDKIKVMRTGEKSDLEFYCDGDKTTLYGKRMNSYSTSDAQPTLDMTFDKAREKLNMELPASDLLYTDVYEGLMQDVVSGKYIGKEMVGNTNCDHLSFAGKEVDWEIWIEEGKNKLPRKYKIISKQIKGKPEASIEITEWDTDIKLEDKFFSFIPPKGAKKVEPSKMMYSLK